MSKGSKRRPKNLRLRGRDPQEENEAGGIRSTAARDDDFAADRLTRPQGPARNRRTGARHEARSPGVRRGSIPTPRNERGRPVDRNLGFDSYSRKGSIFRPGYQPHRHPPTPQATSSFSHPSVRRSTRPATPGCAACAVIRAANSRLYGSLLAGMRRDRAALDAWADDVGVGDGSTIEEMDWQPESMTIVVPTERRLSEMRRMVHAADSNSAAAPGYAGVAAAATTVPALGGFWGPRPAAMGMGMPRSADVAGLMHTCKECGYGAAQNQGYTQGSTFRQNEPFKLPFPSIAIPPQNPGYTVGMRVRSASGYESTSTLMAGVAPEVLTTGRSASILHPGNIGLGSATRGPSTFAQGCGAVVSDAFTVTRELLPVMEGSDSEAPGSHGIIADRKFRVR